MNRGQRYDKMVKNPSSDELGFFENYIENMELIRESIRDIAPKILYDLGCGTGNLCGDLTADIPSIIGIDMSEEMLDTARYKYPEMKLICEDVTKWISNYNPSKDELIVSSFLLHGIKDKPTMLDGFRRVIKAGCRVIILDYMFKSHASKIAYIKELKDLGKENLAQIIESKHYVNVDELSKWAEDSGIDLRIELLTHWITAIDMQMK